MEPKASICGACKNKIGLVDFVKGLIYSITGLCADCYYSEFGHDKPDEPVPPVFADFIDELD